MADTDSHPRSSTQILHWFTVLSVILALVFFALALWITSSPWSDLFLGMATSFVFLAMTNLILRLQAWWSYRRIRDFFGAELVQGTTWLAYPDFEPTPQAHEAWSGVGRRWQRPEGPNLSRAPLPQHDLPIEFEVTVAANDIQGLIEFAGALGYAHVAATSLVVDRTIWNDSQRSFCAAGLTSNHCTNLYLITDKNPLFEILSHNGHPTVRLATGHVLIDDDIREFGIIMRYRPDSAGTPDRRWWLVAGLEAAGTPAAGRFVASKWRTLFECTRPNSDFIAVVSLARGAWHDARLELVVERSSADDQPRIAFDSHWLSSQNTTIPPEGEAFAAKDTSSH